MSSRFTVAIPTRDRADTLESALQTCVTQDYDNFEIIVSDNASVDHTEEIVRSVDDPRIRYVNTGHRISMTDNFEFALGHSGDGFVTMIGDDDGLLPHALVDLDAAMSSLKCDAIVWPMQNYYWPDFFEPTLANRLSMTLHQPNIIRQISANDMLRKIIGFQLSYRLLPSPYFGFVHQDVLQAVRARSERFFHSITPDIYAGFAVASVLDSYHLSSRAYSLSGQSRHSNGASGITGQGEADIDSELIRNRRENALPFHSDIGYANSIIVLTAEAFMQARDHIGMPRDIEIDIPDMIRATLREQNFLLNPSVQESVIRALQDTGDRQNIGDLASRIIQRTQFERFARVILEVVKLVLVANPLFNCAPYGAKNIYDASLIFEKIVGDNVNPTTRYMNTAIARLRKAFRVGEAGVRRMNSRGTSPK